MNGTAWLNKTLSQTTPIPLPGKGMRLEGLKKQPNRDLQSIETPPETSTEPEQKEKAMERKPAARRIAKYDRRPLGDPNTYLKELMKKPVLTMRDKEVLLSIYRHRCLTTQQLTEMHFKYRETNPKLENNQAAVVARRRIRKLFDFQLVERFFIDTDKGSSQGHIMLDQLGAKVVAGLLNCSLNEMNWRNDTNEYRLPFLQHIVEINDFYLSLLGKAREFGHEVGEFQTEKQARFEFDYIGSKVVLNPDAYGQYFVGDYGFHFFLEWDRNTMSVPTFQKKQHRYAAFYASDEYRQHYATFPIVLTVAPNLERVMKLRECIVAIDNTDIVWLFNTKEQVERDVLSGWIGKEGDQMNLLETL